MTPHAFMLCGNVACIYYTLLWYHPLLQWCYGSPLDRSTLDWCVPGIHPSRGCSSSFGLGSVSQYAHCQRTSQTFLFLGRRCLDIRLGLLLAHLVLCSFHCRYWLVASVVGVVRVVPVMLLTLLRLLCWMWQLIPCRLMLGLLHWRHWRRQAYHGSHWC